MPLEVATYINGLDSANPAATDAKSQGDDHLRLIKSTVKTTFPNVAGTVTATHIQLSYVTGVTSPIQPQINLKADITGNVATATRAQGNGFANTPSASEGQMIVKITGQNDAYLFNNATAWGLFSTSGGAIVNYDRATSLATFTGRATNSIGETQTWQNMTGSRAFGTIYTNSTGRPIMVSVLANLNSAANCNITVAGIVVGFASNPSAGSLTDCVQAIIPTGAQYIVSLSGGGSLNTWSELRT